VIRLVLVGASAAALAAAGAASGAVASFRTPSGNIGCVWTSDPSYIRCDILSGLKPRPKPSSACELEFGYGVQMRRQARVTYVCAGDTAILPSAPKLAYGKTWRRGGITCLSRRVGLRCTNEAGHGWFLSRQRSTVS
jgi:hypothetical protein